MNWSWPNGQLLFYSPSGKGKPPTSYVFSFTSLRVPYIIASLFASLRAATRNPQLERDAGAGPA